MRTIAENNFGIQTEEEEESQFVVLICYERWREGRSTVAMTMWAEWCYLREDTSKSPVYANHIESCLEWGEYQWLEIKIFCMFVRLFHSLPDARKIQSGLLYTKLLSMQTFQVLQIFIEHKEILPYSYTKILETSWKQINRTLRQRGCYKSFVLELMM